MATCPRCHGYLGDGHVCRGRGARMWSRFWTLAVAVVLGGLVGSAIFGVIGRMFDVPGADTVGLIIGPIAAFVILRAVRHW